MSEKEVSIIIPVHNNWDLTRICLQSLADTIDMPGVEIIVIDNASSDQTASACPALGASLFGGDFHYIRNELNRNFAGASNQGAKAANGRFLTFLNNDTETLPNWLGPLLADFKEQPNIAATGPVLAYPEIGPLGRAVQHLGVVFKAWLRVAHLYKGIPVASPLARKRRFFQAITAACMLIPRTLFLESGGFDESFINGFEDIDLCARLWNRGYRFTINPDSLVLHYESRTQGRHAHESENTERLFEGNLGHFMPDWHLKLKEDGLLPMITPFGIASVRYPDRLALDLDARARSMKREGLLASLTRYPLWETGWHALLRRSRNPEERENISSELIQIFPTPPNLLIGCNLAAQMNNTELLGKYLSSIREILDSPESIRHKILRNREWCAALNLTSITNAYDTWLESYEIFKNRIYPEFATDFLKLGKKIGLDLKPANETFYNIWLNFAKEAKCSPNEPETENRPAFSILMPVYNPDIEFFRRAIESVIAQTWPHWELCIADDASTNPEIKTLIEEYAQKDSRIKPIFREKNGHIAAATNSALQLAEQPWIAFMDHDDELTPDALASVAQAIADNPDGLLFYSDEDKITEYGHHCRPYFKGDWDPVLILQQNFVCHFTVCRADRLREIGGLKLDFPGAQDHELVLRYSEGLPPGAIIHISKVLYNWREHQGSTAKNIYVKDYALDSSVKAVQTHLDRISSDANAARMEDGIWTRVHFPLPKARPLASIVISSLPFPDMERFLAARTKYPFEIAESVSKANGEILAFLNPWALPWTQNWLEELVAALWIDNVGAVGGSVIGYDGRQLHAGYLADASRNLKPVFHNAVRDTYKGWLNLARTVNAVDGLSLLTRKKDFERLEGLDASLGDWAFQDYCLRLASQGQRTVWVPFARFIAARQIDLPKAPEAFNEKWPLAPFNRNLKIIDQDFALNPDAQNVRAC